MFWFLEFCTGVLAGMPPNFIPLLACSSFLRPSCLLIGAIHVIMVFALVENAAADDTLVTKALAIPFANSAY